ncbi:chloramphenicol acetyltransferase [Shimia sp. R11_0]|uniref:chloramphenicol acetyltransferase n=1 Tax=Shimia sp. R11_0 TaxID=2821096 RepID=UPI001ADD2DBD|nr:chloramphenicol acetyltransferase [Shimia sp. R11_0]MBO9478545.1 chloramphenicol acetyltransferase [Shimia sp. R11_0]
MPRLSAEHPTIHADCILHEATFGRYVEIGQGSRIISAHFDDYSYCDRMAEVANAKIGKFANIAAFTRIGATDHPMETASLHHFLYRSDDYFEGAEPDHAFFEQRRQRVATIGHDTWVGHGAMIKPEVTLGHGSIVASGAVVTKDVPPYMIVAGMPATPLRARFSPEVADRLMALAWWDWPHEDLHAALTDFRALSAEAFLEKYNG